jgi:hypothetical protein
MLLEFVIDIRKAIKQTEKVIMVYSGEPDI